MYFHQPVMPAQALKYLAVTADNVYIDCTTGEGGHSEVLLKSVKPKLLVCIEQDNDVLKIAKDRLKKYDNVIFVNDNFKNIGTIASNLKLDQVNGILLDLGLSMYHYKQSPKGLSLYKDDRLDMRLNGSRTVSAYDIINQYPEQEITKIIWAYGEERWARKIGRDIVETRKLKKINTAKELAQLIERSIPRKFWNKGIHPATRTFQALRIAVNDELPNLEKVIDNGISLLSRYGRMVVISYHSLEDRIVKNLFRLYSKGYDDDGHEFPDKQGILNVLTKKPDMAEEQEINSNHSARSAKMRAAEKIL